MQIGRATDTCWGSIVNTDFSFNDAVIAVVRRRSSERTGSKGGSGKKKCHAQTTYPSQQVQRHSVVQQNGWLCVHRCLGRHGHIAHVASRHLSTHTQSKNCTGTGCCVRIVIVMPTSNSITPLPFASPFPLRGRYWYIPT